MPPKRKAVESLAGPSKKRIVAAGGNTAAKRERRAQDLSVSFETAGTAVVQALAEIATQTAKGVEESESFLTENGQLQQLEEDLHQRRMGGLEVEWRLEREQLFRLKEEEQQAAYRQDEARQDRIQEEILIHVKMDIMQLVRTEFRKPTETDKDVRLSKMPNDREVLKATGDRQNPLSTAGRGRGRFYIEAAAMWDDWCERMDAVAAEDRGSVLPRKYKEVKAARSAKEKEITRAIEARSAAEAAKRAADRERQLELAETQRRLPEIPAHAPGQHPGHRRIKGQTKWSKRSLEAESTPPPTGRVGPKLAAPKKPAGKGKGKAKKR